MNLVFYLIWPKITYLYIITYKIHCSFNEPLNCLVYKTLENSETYLSQVPTVTKVILRVLFLFNQQSKTQRHSVYIDMREAANSYFGKAATVEVFA